MIAKERVRTCGFTLDVNPEDEIGTSLIQKHTYEPECVRTIRDHLQPGQIAIDVGSSPGWHVLHMSRAIGQFGKVYAFEPDCRRCHRLIANLALNHVENANIMPVDLAHPETNVRSICNPHRLDLIRVDKACALEPVLDALGSLIEVHRPVLLLTSPAVNAPEFDSSALMRSLWRVGYSIANMETGEPLSRHVIRTWKKDDRVSIVAIERGSKDEHAKG